MKVLVTGANGYIGTGVIKCLLNDGINVVATDFSIEHIDTRAERIAANIFELENPYEFFGRPNVILHLAWRDGFVHNSKSHINDLPNHYAFLSKLIDNNIGRVCVLGSMHEIGFYEGCVSENTPCNPQSLYGIAKNSLRQALDVKILGSNTGFQWIRGYYIVGNTEYGNSIFSKITQAEKRGEKEFPFTTGVNQYDFIDYEDFCNQVASVVEQDKIVGIINCCSGYPQTLAKRVETFIKENNYNIKLKYGVYPDRAYDSKAIWGEASKIKLILSNKEQ